MTPLIGFCPDLDPLTQGVFTDCENVIPIEFGFKGAPTEVDVGRPALAAECRGAALLTNLINNRRFFAGTATKLYEDTGGTFDDVSRVGDYALGDDDRWTFIQYGNASLAATISAKIQRSTGGDFSDITAAPKAAMIEAVKGFAIAFYTDDTTYGSSPDRWWCSALNDETDWTPSVATQANTGRLIGGSGPITAARRFGDDVIAYKEKAMFVGRYAGSPEVWAFQQVSNDAGCVGKEAVVDTLIGHVFVGEDNIYLYDGTTPRPLDGVEVIRTWLFKDINPLYRFKTILYWDRIGYTVTFHYVSKSSTGAIDKAVIYHVKTKKWGIANRAIEAAFSYVTPGITYDGGSSLITTFDGSTNLPPFDSPFWTAGSAVPGAFNSSHVLVALSGQTASSYFVTGDFGDDEGYRTCDCVRVRYVQKPTTSTATGFYRDESGAVVSTGDSEASEDGKHDMRQDARFHRFRIAQTGDWEANAIRPTLIETGSR